MGTVVRLQEWREQTLVVEKVQEAVAEFWRRQETVEEMMAEYREVARAVELGELFRELDQLDELDELDRAIRLGDPDGPHFSCISCGDRLLRTEGDRCGQCIESAGA